MSCPVSELDEALGNCLELRRLRSSSEELLAKLTKLTPPDWV